MPFRLSDRRLGPNWKSFFINKVAVGRRIDGVKRRNIFQGMDLDQHNLASNDALLDIGREELVGIEKRLVRDSLPVFIAFLSDDQAVQMGGRLRGAPGR